MITMCKGRYIRMERTSSGEKEKGERRSQKSAVVKTALVYLVAVAHTPKEHLKGES